MDKKNLDPTLIKIYRKNRAKGWPAYYAYVKAKHTIWVRQNQPEY